MLYIARVSEFDNMKLRQHEPGWPQLRSGEQVRSHISSSEGHRSLPTGNLCGAQVTLRRTGACVLSASSDIPSDSNETHSDTGHGQRQRLN